MFSCSCEYETLLYNVTYEMVIVLKLYNCHIILLITACFGFFLWGVGGGWIWWDLFIYFYSFFYFINIIILSFFFTCEYETLLYNVRNEMVIVLKLYNYKIVILFC